MHCYGERYNHLYLPGPGYVAESIRQCPARVDGCSNTCHPLSIIKSPLPRWQSFPQPLTYVCPQPGASQASLLPCQPLVQKCVVLYPEPREAARLLPRADPEPVPAQSCCQPCKTTQPEKRRVAKSLPPCAPRCPEPGRLRLPPCGIRYAASCKDEGRSLRLAKGSSRWYGPDLRLQGLTGGYSLPLRGVTECPPQPCLQEYAQHKCTKGYPTQECVPPPPCPAEQRLAKSPPEPPRAPKCPPGKGLKEQKAATKSSLLPPPQEGAKTKSSSAQHLSKSRCLYPRVASHRHHHHHHHQAKRSSHPKKSRCASKWLW
ncbi:uncharacterized protein LOC114071391 [Empidonax traillii]|uniref:uncharacterized protein LOC114071391 n=1 Tax=Empidonax traillii TaxID=164674 RepID=UPI000FFD9891|nr:uncharacterized protein LOC114071391 [Empidonax traillii]